MFRFAARSLARHSCSTRRMQFVQRSRFSEAAGISKEKIQQRIFDVLKGFEKVDPAKVSVDCYVSDS